MNCLEMFVENPVVKCHKYITRTENVMVDVKESTSVSLQTFHVLFLSIFLYVCLPRHFCLPVRRHMLLSFSSLCVILYSHLLVYDKIILCKMLCLHVFFEFVLQRYLFGCVWHRKYIVRNVVSGTRKSAFGGCDAYLIQIIYLICFHNNTFVVGYF